MTKSRRDARSWSARAAVAGLTALMFLSACGSSRPAAIPTTTTTSTLPPLPPNLLAYVTLAGSGASLGSGSSLVEVTVAPGPESVGSPIATGVYPDAVAVAPDGRLALVANYSSNTVTPILLPSNKALPAINAGSGPADVAIAPDGKTAYVTDAGSDTVTPINLKTLKPGTPFVVGAGPQGIAITPDGTRAYVADAGAILSGQTGTIGHDVTPIDLSTGKVLPPIPVGNAPIGVAVSPDGSTVFVTNANSESVTPITVATDAAGFGISTAGGPVAVAVADGAAWVINTPAGRLAGNNVQPISLTSNTAGTPIALPKGAQNIAIAPSGVTAWVVCLNSDKLVPVNLATRRAGAPVTVPGGPFAVAVAYQPRGPTPAPSATSTAKKSKS